jgi:hypothetical protein
MTQHGCSYPPVTSYVRWAYLPRDQCHFTGDPGFRGLSCTVPQYRQANAKIVPSIAMNASLRIFFFNLLPTNNPTDAVQYQQVKASLNKPRISFNYIYRTVSWARALPTHMERLRNRLVMILYHLRKYFGGTKTSHMHRKRWIWTPRVCENKHKRQPTRSTSESSNDSRWTYY